MSDAIEKTAAGATRGFFGSLGFILLMLGLEGMTGAAGIQFGVGLFLALIGGLCFYAAFFWETAKKVLSAEAQQAVGHLAQSRVTWFGMIFLGLETLILSRFIEERHWPFSYPADPQVGVENVVLHTQLQQKDADFLAEKAVADMWKFSARLRSIAPENSTSTCLYQIIHDQKTSGIIPVWMELPGWCLERECFGQRRAQW